ncbi:hypothetical protein QKU94_gp2 [Arlivirus sp. virus]|uniref:Glycoprotein n=1 Tax=Arlivirus sp. virus TaxID=2809160 RepID=A0AAX1PC82_9MONO|nr:hypothetical protein QKU94_gp2 [Arlivirus sp. virus]QXV86526.1 hypothetical protein [Arlivirus sp. virus]
MTDLAKIITSMIYLSFILFTTTLDQTIASMMWNPTPIYYPQVGVLIVPQGLAVHPRSYGTFRLILNFNYPSARFGMETECGTKWEMGLLLKTITMCTEDFETMMEAFQGNATLSESICHRYGELLCRDFSGPSGEEYTDTPLNKDSSPSANRIKRETLKHKETPLPRQKTRARISNRHSISPDIGIDTPKARSKRFLPVLAAGLGLSGLGLSIYNTINEHDVTGQIRSLTHNMEEIEETVNKIRHTSEEFIKLEKDAFIHNMHMIRGLEGQVGQLDCKMEMENDLLNTLSFLQFAHNKYERIVQSIFRGEVTNEMLLPKNLLNILAGHPDWGNTIYYSDISLFYQLARSTPLHYSKETKTLHVLIKFPVAEEDDIAPLLAIKSLGFPQSSSDSWRQLRLPENVGLFPSSSSFEALDLTLRDCRQIDWLWLCSSLGVSNSNEARCISGLLKSKGEILPDSCQYNLKTTMLPIVHPVPGGVIVTGYDSYQLFSVSIRGLHIGETKKLKEKEWNYIKISDPESIKIGSLYYKSSITGGDIIIQEPKISMNFSPIYTLSNVTDWVAENEYLSRYDSLIHSLPAELLLTWPVIGVSTWIIILTIIVILLLFYICYKRKQLITQGGRSFSNMEVVALKRIDPITKKPQRL